MSDQDRRQFVRLCECGCGEPTLLAAETNAKYGWRKGRPMRFIAHHGAAPRRTPWDRFWEKVDAFGVCWEWTGFCSPAGYGRFRWEGKATQYAHRLAWEALIGPIPEGMTLDHLCRNPRCVNPDHLEVVTNAENIKRSGAPSIISARMNRCRQGHDLTTSNGGVDRRGRRYCKACKQARNRIYAAKKRQVPR